MQNKGLRTKLLILLAQSRYFRSIKTVQITIRCSKHKIVTKIKPMTLKDFESFKLTQITSTHQGQCQPTPQHINSIYQLWERAKCSKTYKGKIYNYDCYIVTEI